MTKPNTLLRTATLAVCLIALTAGTALAERPKSPEGSAATQIGDGWIDVTYSRPILRGRTDIFGSGEEYGKTVSGSSPVWRAGANVTTRIKTEHDLMINGTKVAAGEYSLFIELKEGAWTAVLSSQPHMTSFDREKMAQGFTWGSGGYSADHDVVRAPMQLMMNEFSVDQMTFFFANVTADGGNLGLAWEKTIAMLPFTIAK